MQTDFRKTSETEHLTVGDLYARESADAPWEFRTEAFQRKGDLWFEGSAQEMLARVGVRCTDAKRASDFANLCDGDLSGYYYIAAASPDGSEDALKWVMGGLATYLNENGLSFKDRNHVLPADYLHAFCTALETAAFERSFAKDIFAELLKAERFVEEPWQHGGFCYFDADADMFRSISEVSWEQYGALVDAEVIDGNAADGMGSQLRRRTGRAVIKQIIADPRFKAVDASAIDAIIDQVMEANPAEVAKARANPRAVQWFVGQIMKASKGKASPQIVQEKLRERFPS